MAKTKTTSKQGWGFDPRELSDSIRPQDDFYQYVNKKWKDTNPIPAAESRWGTFNILRLDSEKKLRAILTKLQAQKKVEPGSPAQMIRDFYASGIDMKKRTSLGAAPIEPLRKKVRAIKNQADLEKLIAELHRIGVEVIWGTGLDQDSKDSTRYVLHLVQDGLGMPDRDYYLKDDAESVRVRTAYLSHIERMHALAGFSKADAKARREIVMQIETALAKISMTKEDSRDTEKTYHKKTLVQLSKLAPGVDWRQYLTRLDAKELKDVIVMQPDFFSGMSNLVKELSLEEWKVYLEWHVINDLAGALSPAFIRASFAFYGTVLAGVKQMKPLWRRILGSVNGNLGELLGQLYVEKHFTPEAKKRMDAVVDDLLTAYQTRLTSLDWMTPVTKKKALQKLAALNRKIGYPKKWRSYRGLVVSPTDYFGNLMRSTEFEHKRTMKKLRGPVDHDEWFMYPQTVNAYFYFNLNDIVFPAAILQPPFFDMGGDDAVNYGAIGAIIGHEITHGFDDQGSKFDKDGNMKTWWTKEDRARFEAKANKVKKQFDQYVVEDGVRVNGQLTLGENIADLGGISIAYDAYQLHLGRAGRQDLGGLTPEQRFFISYAVAWRENARPEFTKTMVLTDPHAPEVFRTNGPLSNFDKFYEAFNVQKGDRLYRDPKEREMVW